MDNNLITISRRSFIQKSSSASAAAAVAFTIIKPELVRGAGKEMLKAGLVGCGGRGTQAVLDMMAGTENIQLVSMGDIFDSNPRPGNLNRANPYATSVHEMSVPRVLISAITTVLNSSRG